jgi:hypothetical protein
MLQFFFLLLLVLFLCLLKIVYYCLMVFKMYSLHDFFLFHKLWTLFHKLDKLLLKQKKLPVLRNTPYGLLFFLNSTVSYTYNCSGKQLFFIITCSFSVFVENCILLPNGIQNVFVVFLGIVHLWFCYPFTQICIIVHKGTIVSQNSCKYKGNTLMIIFKEFQQKIFFICMIYIYPAYGKEKFNWSSLLRWSQFLFLKHIFLFRTRYIW